MFGYKVQAFLLVAGLMGFALRFSRLTQRIGKLSAHHGKTSFVLTL